MCSPASELPAAVVVDAVARLIPGVLGEAASVEEESFTTGLLEYPHYTRPREFRGLEVPEVLLSGHHEEIRKWRRRQSLMRTIERRPELLHRAELSREDKKNPDRDKGFVEWPRPVMRVLKAVSPPFLFVDA